MVLLAYLGATSRSSYLMCLLLSRYWKATLKDQHKTFLRALIWSETQLSTWPMDSRALNALNTKPMDFEEKVGNSPELTWC